MMDIKKRILSAALALVMAFTILPVTALAALEPSPAASPALTAPAPSASPVPSAQPLVILSFDALARTEYEVALGTALGDIGLPDTLALVISTDGGESAAAAENLTWTGEYNPAQAGTYTLSAQAEGYVLSQGLSWPSLTVTVLPGAPEPTAAPAQAPVILSFEALAYTDYEVPLGTALGDIGLPDTLALIISTEGGESAATAENLTWTGEYDPAQAGTYTLSAQAEGYALSQGLSWPSVTVTVLPEASEPDEIDLLIAAIDALPELDPGDVDMEDEAAFEAWLSEQYQIYQEVPALYEQLMLYGDDAAAMERIGAERADKLTGLYTMLFGVAVMAEASDNWTSYAAAAYAGGSGSSGDPWLINTPQQLAFLAQQANDVTNYSGKYFKLGANIDLSAHYWTPIGHDDRKFNGHFDGGNYTIYGMNIVTASTINKSGKWLNAGFFGRTESGTTIKNVNIVGAMIDVDQSAHDQTLNVGGIGGFLPNNEITSCSFSGSISARFSCSYILGTSSIYVGGIVGRTSDSSTSYGSNFTDCAVFGSISASSPSVYKCHIGGIGGETSHGTSKGKMYNCYANGSLANSATTTNSLYLGGVVGYTNMWKASTEMYYRYPQGAEAFGKIQSGLQQSAATRLDSDQAMIAAMINGLPDWSQSADVNGAYPIPAQLYDVSYNANGGSSSGKAAFGYPLTLPAEPTRAGYTFAGWYDDPDSGSLYSAGRTYLRSEGLVLYAHWRCSGHVYDNSCDTTCNICGETRSISHSWTAATCTLPKTCSVCGLTEGAALGHLSAADPAVPSTCTATGLTAGSHCSVCGLTLAAQIPTPMKSHSSAADPAVAATCTATGLTAGSHCSVCGEVLSPRTIVPALGHSWGAPSYSWSGKSCTAQRSCVRSGCASKETETVSAASQVTQTKSCTLDELSTYTAAFANSAFSTQSKTNVKTADRLGHAYTASVTAPSCTAQGYTSHSCSRCGDSYVDSYVSAAGHRSVADPAVPAACTATGLTAGSHCSVCGEVLSQQTIVPALGHRSVADPAVAATCTATGLTAGSHCSVCGEILTAQETVSALGHRSVADPAVAATCTTTGLTAGSHCSVCGEVISAQTIVPALGHRSVTDPAVAATCTATGLAAGSHCSVCGETLTAQETVPALGHRSVADPAVAATCTTTGLTAGSHCSVCDEILTAQETVSALGHTVVADPAVAETCTETGLTAGSHCSVCDEILTTQETVPALGHTTVTDAAVAATCTETGLTAGSHCSVCDETLTAQETVSALGHRSVADPAVAATCTETGLTAGSHCSVCDEILTAQETVSALGHTVVADPAVAATCTATGLTAGSHCSVCGETLTAQETVPALGHRSVADPAVAATCTATGLTAGSHCSVCGEILTAQETVPALGHRSVTDLAVAATCTTTGLTAGSHCSVCGEVLSAQTIVPALGHRSVADPAVAPTCTETGLTAGSHCSVCDEILTAQETVSALGHTVVADQAVAATCTETGLTAGSHCSVCDEILTTQETVPALGHTTVTDAAVAPTCTETGLAAGSHCSVCDEILTAQETVPALGHSSVADPAVAATCTETGLTVGSHCSVCDEILTAQETVPALGHSSVTDPAVAATCTATGLTAGSHCSVCGEILTAQETVPALGHTAVTDPAVAPTCTATGLTAGSHCSVCDEILTTQETVPALGHTVVADPAVAATCTETGLTSGSHCSVCNEILTAQETVPALGHTAVTDPAVAPTCTATGLTAGSHCSVCNEILTAQETVPALGHTTVTDAAVAPTCTATGLTAGSHCSVCGEILTAQETIFALGHSYTAAVTAPGCTEQGYTTHSCTRCGDSYVDGYVSATGHDWGDWVSNGDGSETRGCGKDAAHTETRSSSYAVTLDANGGRVDSDAVTEYTFGIGAALPTAVTKAGYTFGGWYTSGSFTGSPVTAIAKTDIGAKSYYAKWSLDAPAVVLRADASAVTYGTALTLSATASHTLTSGLSYGYEWYKDNNKVSGSTSTLSLSDVSHSGSYTVKVTAADGALTSAATESSALAVTISPAAHSQPGAPSLASASYSGITVTAVEGQRYICRPQSAAAPAYSDSGWNDSGVFSGLDPNSEYMLYTYKPAADGNHSASPISQPLAVTTEKVKITALTPPPNVVLSAYYASGSGGVGELAGTAASTAEDGTSPSLSLTWTPPAGYDAAPGAANTFRWSAAAPENYEFAADVSAVGSVTVTNKAATAVRHSVVADKGVKTYAEAAIDLRDMFSLDENAGTASYSITPLTGKGSCTEAGVLSVTKAGDFTVKVNTQASGNYAAGEQSAALTVKPAPGAGRVSIDAYTYGGPISEPSVRENTGAATYYYSTSERGSGTKWEEIGPSTLSAGEYWLYAKIAASELYSAYTTESVKFTVGKLGLTPSVESVSPREYNGGTDAAGTLSLAAAEGCAIPAGEMPMAVGTFAWTAPDGGTATVNVTEIQLTNAYVNRNYQLDAEALSDVTAPGGVKISPRALNITAKPQTVTYGQSIDLGTGQVYVTGLADGDRLDSLTLTPSGAQVAGDKSIRPGAAVIKRGERTVSGSYSITYGVGALTITEAAMSPSVSGYDGTYDSAAHGITVTMNGAEIKYGRTGGTYDMDSSPSYADAGEYTVYYQVTKTNYATVTGSAPVKIAPKALTADMIGPIAAANYDGQAQTPAPPVSWTPGDGSPLTLRAGEDKDFTFSYAGNTDAALSTAGNAPTVTITAVEGGNYSGSACKTFTIAKAPISFTVADNEYTYNAQQRSAAVTQREGQRPAIAENGFSVSYQSANDTATAHKTDAGDYAIIVTLTDDNFCFIGERDENTRSHTLAQKLSIGKKPVTVQWKNLIHVYDGGDKSPDFVINDGDLLSADSGQVRAQLGGEARAEAGTYTVSASLTGSRASNYRLTNPSGSLIIQKAPVSFAVSGNSLRHDGSWHLATVTATANGVPFTGFTVSYKNANGETVAAPTNAGSYGVYAAITDPNYRHSDSAQGTARKIGVLTIYMAAPPPLYTLSFNVGDGTALPPMEAAQAGTERILPPCSGGDRIFLGWQYQGRLYQPGQALTQPESNITLKAKWADRTYSVGGAVDGSGEPLENVVVTLMLGSQQIGQTLTDAEGKYRFDGVPPGIYNLAARRDGVTQTILVVIKKANAEEQNITMPRGKLSSVVEVTAGSPAVVVGNLENAFTPEDVQAADDTHVELKLTVDAKAADGSAAQEAISRRDSAVGLYLELTLTRTVGGGTPETLDSSPVLLTAVITLPGDLQGKDRYTVYRMHGDELQTLSATPNGEGEKIVVSADKTTLTVYMKNFSIYAVSGTKRQAAESTVPTPTGSPAPTERIRPSAPLDRPDAAAGAPAPTAHPLEPAPPAYSPEAAYSGAAPPMGATLLPLALGGTALTALLLLLLLGRKKKDEEDNKEDGNEDGKGDDKEDDGA